MCVCTRTLSLMSSLCREAWPLLLSLIDGDRSRFLIRLRIVPLPSAAIAPLAALLAALLAAPLAAPLSGSSLSPPPALLLLLLLRSFRPRAEPSRA